MFSKPMKQLISDSGKMYTLSSSKHGQHVLRVMCGGFAMYERSLILTEDEIAQYQTQGKGFIDNLAYKVAKGLPNYVARSET